jgi:hypothetical protein
MRDIKILNKNYEVANLYTVVYEGYTIKEIIEDTPVFSVTPPQHYLDYWQKIYDYLKSGTKVAGHTYLPQGQSKYDVAYVNKTIDDPIAELNGHTLREVFEEGNQNNNNLAELSFTGYGWGYGSFDWISGDDYYIRISHKVVSDIYDGSYGLNRIIFTDGTVGLYMTQSIIDNGVYETKSFNITALTTQTTHLTLYGSSAGPSKIQYAKDIYVINKDALGISSLVDMDYYFSLYQARKNITKKVLTYVDIFEEIQELVNPNFDEGTNGWGFYVSDCGLSVQDGIATFAPAVSSAGIAQSLLQEKDTDYYFAIKGKAQETGNIGVGFATNAVGTQIINFTITTNMEFYSQIFKSLQEFNTFVVGREVNTYTLDYIHLINKKHFDELITKEQLDTMLAHYLLVKNIVIYPEIYIPTDPTGFGNRYAFLELNKKVYGHELDFENMQVNLLFGVYKNAYDSYNQLMNFIINNEGIIAYDYGKGVRYTDIRLIKSPKTELDDGQYLKEKFDFKRLSPFYTLEQGSSLTIKNIHDWDIKPIVSGNVNTNIVYIEAEEITSGLLKAVKFDFTALTKPFDFYYNAETKQILINGINNGYQYIDFSFGISFISLPKDSEYVIWTTGITSPTVKAKKWVID